MLRKVTILDWDIEIDVAATAQANRKQTVVWPDGCTCLYCRNFAAAIFLLPHEFVNLCAEIGVDPVRAVEVYELGPAGDTARLYGGWYHIVGRLISGPAQGSTSIDTMLASKLEVSFTEAAALVADSFPR